jgi:hypothetical protein
VLRTPDNSCETNVAASRALVPRRHLEGRSLASRARKFCKRMMTGAEARRLVEKFPVLLDQELARCSADEIPDYFRFLAEIAEYLEPIRRYADAEYHKGNPAAMQLLDEVWEQLSARKLRDQRQMERLSGKRDRSSIRKRARAFRRWKLVGKYYGYFEADTDSKKHTITDLEYRLKHETNLEKRAALELEIKEVLSLYGSEDLMEAMRLRRAGKLEEALRVVDRGLAKWEESTDLHHFKSQLYSELAARSAQQGLNAEPSDVALRAQASILDASSRLREDLIARGTAPEEILVEIEALTAGAAAEFDLKSVQAQALANLAPGIELPEDVHHFLFTGEFLAKQSSTGFDYSAIAVQFSKAVEVALEITIFRRWRAARRAGNTGEPCDATDGKLRALSLYLKAERKLTLGEMRFYLEFARKSDATRRREPILDSLSSFLESTANNGARLDELLENLTQNNIDWFRNGAAHGTRFDRSRALETREWSYRLLNIIGSMRRHRAQEP